MAFSQAKQSIDGTGDGAEDRFNVGVMLGAPDRLNVGVMLGAPDSTLLGSVDPSKLGVLLGDVDGSLLGIMLGVADGIELTDGMSDTDGANDMEQQVLQQFATTSGNPHLLSILSLCATAHAQSSSLPKLAMKNVPVVASSQFKQSTDGVRDGTVVGVSDGALLGIMLGVADGTKLTDGMTDSDGANDLEQQVLQQFAATSGYPHLFPIFGFAHEQATVLFTAAT